MKIGIVILAIVIMYAVYCYNSLIRLSTKCKEADAGIDVALTKRYTVIQNMIEICKGYMKHEKETLSMIVELRNQMSMKEKELAYEKMNQVERNMKVVAEQYPELKADALFLNLQNSLTDVEEHLQAARRAYNANVSILNQKIEMIPSNFIAFICRFHKRAFFEAKETERDIPEIKF